MLLGGRLTQASRLGNASKIGPFFLKYAVPISQKTCRATQTLQEILTAMQNNQTSDRETLDEINEIFVRRLGQHTIKGLRQAANPSASKTE